MIWNYDAHSRHALATGWQVPGFLKLLFVCEGCVYKQACLCVCLPLGLSKITQVK